MKVEAALGLGGNLGDPVAAFATVLRRLQTHEAVSRVRSSSVYRTAPWGKLDQPEFLNMAMLVETALPARALLDLCLSLEREGGRERRERWGPRTLDIDILNYGGETIDEPGLQVPHPRIAERAFVLAPLAEIAPGQVIGGRTVAELLKAVVDESIRRDPAATARLQAVFPSAPR
ncbi:MAG: 2-amino-4-hydroxy-6-hydroxymethyldihydropteridine diphosphokinase [Bosea sp. (in: a-proteobacteria)]|uniref:2-amino-4-hydroxy-6- hydroxymethyldihydropteridine diphosphokinase n=1 Tax=Bosea sp. (in: a-proteobacteria) TaxID=1871050 RepID=UPI0027323FD9|nr:2-amino-4-hydroxy-6-hydroxymethyldihydropteridine diphosphokinase [Bosea sp. (in: a-proteobacteria)]MDP3257782.1 2-amino-4-hydroxy-6-hydroxymethyldihydropteridine diphosphokinase [Bosea sp. (in: a-proteobacteria)]MDP3318978.1 2-amino-4-hydroxy-6-hydroxymethyldihydropteridine diphosphokinase [Bosea sp. (in: a-proteobacteria)]